jgi:hypothetical protein
MNCPNCGAALGPADLQQPACRHCAAMHPHVAQAAAKVEVVKQLLAPGPGGVPAALQGMMGAYGQPMGGVPPMGAFPPGAVPPMGAMPPGYAMAGHQAALQVMNDVRRRTRTMVIVITAVTLVFMLVVFGGVIAAVLFAG